MDVQRLAQLSLFDIICRLEILDIFGQDIYIFDVHELPWTSWHPAPLLNSECASGTQISPQGRIHQTKSRSTRTIECFLQLHATKRRIWSSNSQISPCKNMPKRHLAMASPHYFTSAWSSKMLRLNLRAIFPHSGFRKNECFQCKNSWVSMISSQAIWQSRLINQTCQGAIRFSYRFLLAMQALMNRICCLSIHQTSSDQLIFLPRRIIHFTLQWTWKKKVLNQQFPEVVLSKLLLPVLFSCDVFNNISIIWESSRKGQGGSTKWNEIMAQTHHMARDSSWKPTLLAPVGWVRYSPLDPSQVTGKFRGQVMDSSSAFGRAFTNCRAAKTARAARAMRLMAAGQWRPKRGAKQRSGAKIFRKIPRFCCKCSVLQVVC